MGKILCSTRGGDASVLTQHAAIEKAKEEGHDLIFFYVVDIDFLEKADIALRQDIVRDEMIKMGSFLMALALERAERQEMTATYVVREGEFLEELKKTVTEEEITLVILGRTGDKSVFHTTNFDNFVKRIQEEIGVEVWIPPAVEE